VVSRRRLRERIAWTSAAVLVLALAATSTFAYRQSRRTTPAMRVSLPAKTAQYSDAGLRLLAPDGSFMIFAATDANDDTRIWKQGIADAQATPIDGTKDGRPLSISPGGRSLLMHQARKLVRVDFAGGSPVALANIAEEWGSTWIDDSSVVYTDSGDRSLWRVSAAGGTPEKLLAPSSATEFLIWPEALPGGRSLLYIASDRKVSGSYEKGLHALDLKTKATRLLMQAPTRTMYADGHLLSVRDGSLSAVRFNPKSLKIEGEPKLLTDGVTNFKPRGNVSISVSSSGLLAYQTPPFNSRLRWLGRDGQILSEFGTATGYSAPSISPDGSRLAAGEIDPKTGVPSLWIYGVARATRERLGFSERYENVPVWTPDRKWIIFHSDRDDVPDIYRRSADGLGAEELLYAAPGLQTPTDVSPDGRWLAFTNSLTGTTGADIMLLSLEEKKAQPWLQTQANEGAATFSRDGRWIAYTSNESGRTEVYVRPFPGPGEKIQITTGGGWAPRWSHDGRELLYLNDRTATSVAIRGNDFAVEEPRRLFTMQTAVQTWELAPDGRILILAVPEEVSHHPVQLIVNWPALMK
jgi:eukaryotic-like serine/threonine-protein kinase